MDKKIIWGIIALVAVLVIAGVVFVVDQEENSDQEEQEVVNVEEDEDLLWDVEDNLFYVYEAIYNLEDISEEEKNSLFERYDDLEERLWDLEESHFDGEIDKEEFEESLQALLEDTKTFLQEIEDETNE